MRYLSGEEVLAIHNDIIDQTGGLHGVRDLHLFASLLEKPKQRLGGHELYADIWKKAAVSLEGFARYHVFVDGNKRTAFAVAARFLFLNGYDLRVLQKFVVRFMLDVAKKKKDTQQIATWLKRYSTPRHRNTD